MFWDREIILSCLSGKVRWDWGSFSLDDSLFLN